MEYRMDSLHIMFIPVRKFIHFIVFALFTTSEWAQFSAREHASGTWTVLTACRSFIISAAVRQSKYSGFMLSVSSLSHQWRRAVMTTSLSPSCRQWQHCRRVGRTVAVGAGQGCLATTCGRVVWPTGTWLERERCMADICTVYMYPFHSFHCSSSEKSLYSISVDTILNTYCLHYRLYSSKSHIFGEIL